MTPEARMGMGLLPTTEDTASATLVKKKKEQNRTAEMKEREGVSKPFVQKK